MSTTTELKPISEMTASEIADMMESGCVKMENVAPMYVRAIELLRKVPCSAEEAIAAWNRRTAAHGEPSKEIDASEREFITKRLRRVAKIVGLESAIPEGDDLIECAGSVLGMIASKLERQSGSAEQVSERDALIRESQASFRLAVRLAVDLCSELWNDGRNADDVVANLCNDFLDCAALQHTAPAPSKAGEWTDEQVDILRRAAEILEHDCGRPHNANELRALLSAPAQAQSEEAK